MTTPLPREMYWQALCREPLVSPHGVNGSGRVLTKSGLLAELNQVIRRSIPSEGVIPFISELEVVTCGETPALWGTVSVAGVENTFRITGFWPEYLVDSDLHPDHQAIVSKIVWAMVYTVTSSFRDFLIIWPALPASQISLR